MIQPVLGIRMTWLKIGVDKSIELVDQSDLILAIFDMSRDFDEEDEKILDLIKGKTPL